MALYELASRGLDVVCLVVCLVHESMMRPPACQTVRVQSYVLWPPQPVNQCAQQCLCVHGAYAAAQAPHETHPYV